MANNSNQKPELTSAEFQRKLFDWFENRGMLAELRSFMRHQMITALRNSGPDGPCSTSRFVAKTPISPTLQALLLLVAEFLVQQEYHYTVSVMVAEVPLLASLPKFSNYVTFMSTPGRPTNSSPTSFPRYTNKDVVEILDTFGIVTESESSHHILRLYADNTTRESLLACVLTALPAVAQSCASKQSKEKQRLTAHDSGMKFLSDSDESAYWIEKIRLVLLHAQLTSAQLKQLEDLLLSMHSTTVSRVQKEEERKHNQLLQIREQQLQAEALVREEEFRSQICQAEDNLDKKHAHLEKVTTQLRQQHDEVLNRLNRLQKHADEVRQQESQLTERESQLEQKLQVLEEERQILASLRSDLQEAARSLRQDQSSSRALLELQHLQERCSHLESELELTRNHLKSSALVMVESGVQVSESQSVPMSAQNAVVPTTEVAVGCNIGSSTHQVMSSGGSSVSSFSCNNSPSKFGNDKQRDRNNQITLLKRVLRRVQQENAELRAHSVQQRRRIDELTTHAAQMAAHVASRADTPVQAHQRTQPTPGPPPTPPPFPPPQLSHRLAHRSSQLGAGEQPSVHAPRQSPATMAHSLRLQGREWRRKPPKRLLQHVSHTTSFSSDESPTEEVMREARNRLRRLEEETDEVDRNYLDFCARQADNLTASTSALYASSHDIPTSTPTVAPQVPSRSYQSSRFTSGLTPLASTYSPHRSRVGVNPISSVSLQSSSHPPSFHLGVSQHTPSVLMPQSQFTFPERSPNLPPTCIAPTRGNESPLYRPSVLGRPTEKIRDLLSTRLSLFKEYSIDGAHATSVPEEPEPNQRPENNQEDTPSPIRSVHDLNVSKTVDELRALNLELSNGLLKKVEKILSSPSKHHEIKSDEARKISHTPPDKLDGSSSFQNNAFAPVEATTDHIADVSRNRSPAELTTQQPELLHSLPSDPPIKNIEECKDESPKQTVSKQSSEIVQPPMNTQAVMGQRPALLETTLNEVSTLSSSTVVSPADVNENKLPSTGDVQEGKPNSPPSSKVNNPPKQAILCSSSPVEDRKTPEVGESSAKETVPPSKSENVDRKQLENASLSSIEISDQAISVGSEGKKSTTDLDDFW